MSLTPDSNISPDDNANYLSLKFDLQIQNELHIQGFNAKKLFYY